MDRRGSRLSRREFVVGAGIGSLGLLSGCGRLPGPAQQPPRSSRVGILGAALPASSPNVAVFRQRLVELGYVEGQNLTLEVRSAEGRQETLLDLAADLTRLQMDVIVAAGDPAIHAVRQSNEAVPIVMTASRDPVGTGLIPSLARPGGNITGLSFFDAQLSGKRLELLREVLPTVARVGALGQSTTLPEYRADEVVASALGLRLQLLEVRSAEDLERAMDTATREQLDALIVLGGSPTNIAYLPWIAEHAMARRLPTMSERKEFAQAGGLMAYGPGIPELWRRAAYYVDRILKGTNPADLPVEQPMTFEFVVNLKTATELGITFPQETLLQVTEVIQ